MQLQVRPIRLLTDNYAWALSAPAAPGAAGPRPAVVVDPSTAAPVAAQLRHWGLQLQAIWLTHHHHDHTGGVQPLCAMLPPLQVIGHAADRHRLPALTQAVAADSWFAALGCDVQVLGTDGHTLGAVCYHLPQANALFTGDTLFTGGCGRLMEGSAEQMLASLTRLDQLPASTRIFCGHEYTARNARFAAELMPDQPQLAAHLAHCEAEAAEGRPLVPQTLAQQRQHNLFLRLHQPSLRRRLGTDDALSTLQRLRALRDQF